MMKKKLIIYCTLFALASLNVFCQIPSAFKTDYYKSSEHKLSSYNNTDKTKNKLLSESDFRPYNVINYNLYMDWYNPMKDSIDTQNRTWTGTNVITLVIDSANTNTIELDAAKLIITSVAINGNKTNNFNQPNSNNIFTINLDNNRKQGDTIVLAIQYQYNNKNNGGFYMYPKGQYVENSGYPYFDSLFVEEKIAYTMSEAEDARYWMPSNDRPNDKATSQITVRVPTGYTVASNGLLKNKITDDSSTTFIWYNKDQIATYLMAASASKYTKFSDWYIRPNGDSVEIQYYVWDKDYQNKTIDNRHFAPEPTFRNVSSMIGIFSQAFIDYPWDKYGMVSIYPFNGGMEHQTITSIQRNWTLADDQGGIAHELAHQWLGDYVTCGSWKDLWMNEGGATWAETFWEEQAYGLDAGIADLAQIKRVYFRAGGMNLHSIYDMPMNDLFNTAITYKKSAWVYAMLRYQLGDSLFFMGLRKYLNKFAQKSAVTDDVEKFWHNEFPDFDYDLTEYFEEWIKGSGHPIYRLNSIINHNYDNTYKIQLTISQLQNSDNVPDVFTMKLPVILEDSDSLQVKTIYLLNNQRIQTFDFDLKFLPAHIYIDTNKVLCEIDGYYTAVQSENSTINADIFPNPVKQGQECLVSIDVQNDSPIQVIVYDVLGNSVKKEHYSSLIPGKQNIYINTSSLSQGTYYVTIFSKYYNRSYKLTIIS